MSTRRPHGTSITRPTPQNSERLTRKQLIDRRITDAGWKIVLQKDFDSAKPLTVYNRCAIEEYPTDTGPADYALVVNGHILGVVEAKKLTLGPQNVLLQAERYSKGVGTSPLHFHGFRVPFLYSTNGEVIWHHDIRHKLNRSREIFGFHTPDAVADHRNAPVNALGYLRVMFAVDDINETLERLRKRGAQLVGEVVQYKDAYRLCYIRGPEGLLIGLAQELS